VRQERFRRFCVSLLTIWALLFLFWGRLSAFWAVSLPHVDHILNSLLKRLLLSLGLSLYVRAQADLDRALRLFLLSIVYMCAFIFVNTPPAEWFGGFLGSVTQNNTNLIGLNAAMGVMVAVYLAFARGGVVYYAAALWLLLLATLTSSRKSLVIAVLGLVMIALLYTRRRFYLFTLAAGLLAAGLAWYLVMHVPVFYQAIGVRFESMLRYWSTGQGDTSVEKREHLIEEALRMFKAHPIVGVGLNNFSAWSSFALYAHNNYLEVLTGLGLTGLALYYWFYLYLLVRLAHQLLLGFRPAALFLSAVFVLLVVEYGQVSYYNPPVFVLLSLCYFGVCVGDGARKAKLGQALV
jgi:O-antigen ligase